MFKMILSGLVVLGFSVAAHAQEGEPAAPSKMEAAPAPEAVVPVKDADKTAAKKKHHKKGKKHADEAPKAE